jgi:hypothetical protein
MNAEDHHDYQGDGDNQRDYRPARDRSGSAAAPNTPQCVIPIPLCLVIEAVRPIIKHE